jgi:hypothetical protein
MGRTDEVQFITECAAAWRSYGARVTFEPAWESRGNGYQGNYEGCLIHHTASPSSPVRPFPTRSVLINGRADLAGPLCNVAGPWCSPDAPWLHVIAAFPSNNAGASGGRSMGPLPVTGLFNPRVLGLEIDYAGTVPMAPGQRLSALIFARGVTQVLGRSVEFCRAHAETSVTGKWDPGEAPGQTISMTAFRRDAAALTPAEETLIVNDADRREIRTIFAEELDKKLDDPRRADKFGNRLATLLRNTGADSSLNAIGAAVKALLGGSPPPTG